MYMYWEVCLHIQCCACVYAYVGLFTVRVSACARLFTVRVSACARLFTVRVSACARLFTVRVSACARLFTVRVSACARLFTVRVSAYARLTFWANETSFLCFLLFIYFFINWGLFLLSNLVFASSVCGDTRREDFPSTLLGLVSADSQ